MTKAAVHRAVVAVAVLALTGCGGTSVEPAADATPEPTTATPIPTPTPTRTTPTPTRTPTPRPDPVPEVMLTCWHFDTSRDRDRVTITAGDFTDAWDAEYDMCDDASRNSAPLSEVEREAFALSGYDDEGSLPTLYELCASFDPYITRPTDAYAAGRIAVTLEQAAEIDGTLVLCPDHPLADEMAADAERGHQDAEWEASGQLFRTGTFLVGDEIEPGTYVIERDKIENCYWERQNSTGGIIENRFILSARRVEVTIRSSDYAFHSQGCGTWRPSR